MMLIYLVKKNIFLQTAGAGRRYNKWLFWESQFPRLCTIYIGKEDSKQPSRAVLCKGISL